MTATPLRILSTIFVSILVTTTIFAQDTRRIGGIETEGLQSLTTETVIAIGDETRRSCEWKKV
jgi:hypothetical protein